MQDAEREKGILNRLGAGLVTGAADDDPSGIATYSQVGAAYGFSLLWSVLLCLPLMIGIQTVCARMGRVTGHGLAHNLKACVPRPLVLGIVGLLFIANIINLSADIGAIGASAKLLIGGPAPLYGAIAATLSVLLQVFVPFARYSPILKLLTLSLFAYVVTVFAIHVPWATVFRHTFWPQVKPSAKYAVSLVAVLGTTISPYLFFWQSSQEAEEVRLIRRRRPLKKAPRQAKAAFARIKNDTIVGMLFSEVVAFFIILTAAVVLHSHGKTDIQSSAEAAAALKPLAGEFAFVLFAFGIIGTGMLAIPVLAGSGAYALGETLKWRVGLDAKPLSAKLFYGTIAVATLAGVSLSFAPIDPIRMLFWSAVINGVVSVPLMFVIMWLSTRSGVMGKFPLPLWLRGLGWASALAMTCATVLMFATIGR